MRNICQRIEQIFRTLDTVLVPSPVDLHQSDIYARSVLQNSKKFLFCVHFDVA